MVFIWTQTYSEIFKSALVYLEVITKGREESLDLSQWTQKTNLTNITR